MFEDIVATPEAQRVLHGFGQLVGNLNVALSSKAPFKLVQRSYEVCPHSEWGALLGQHVLACFNTHGTSEVTRALFKIVHAQPWHVECSSASNALRFEELEG